MRKESSLWAFPAIVLRLSLWTGVEIFYGKARLYGLIPVQSTWSNHSSMK
jgi:hypothetical protein